jgi:hypothetical protein
LNFKINNLKFIQSTPLTANDLRANEGRETEALNCKPITNLKEISELSNYSKTSGFRLHAVIGCSAHAVYQDTNSSYILLKVGLNKQYVSHKLKIPMLQNAFLNMVCFIVETELFSKR